jgi:hypothetical protein
MPLKNRFSKGTKGKIAPETAEAKEQQQQHARERW